MGNQRIPTNGRAHARWSIFMSLWFAQAFFQAMFIAWTPIAYASFQHPDDATWFVWLLLAIAITFSAAACAVAWAFLLLGPIDYCFPRSATGRRIRRTPDHTQG